jgi:hypothetical protein
LAEQSYIRRWRFVPGKDAGIDYDFGLWRNRYDGYSNLARSQAIHFGVDPLIVDQPWIEVEHPAAVARGRHPEPPLPPARLPLAGAGAALPQRGGRAGHAQSEFEELFHLYGFAKHVETLTLAEMARVIAGAELVITNQTAAYAIAEGLKKTVILERYPRCPNVDFDRPGVYTASGSGSSSNRGRRVRAAERRAHRRRHALPAPEAPPIEPDGQEHKPWPRSNEDKILDNALAPKRASGDAGSMEQHSIPDQIEGIRFAAPRRRPRPARPASVTSR